MKKRIMLFIDAEYVIQSLRHVSNLQRASLDKIDWGKIISAIGKDRDLIRTYYYTCELSRETNETTYNQQREYLNKLKKENDFLQIKMGRLIKTKDTWVQKGVDVKIAVDMVTKAFSNQYDIAALIAGDSDFVSMVYEVKESYGKQVEVYAFERWDTSVHDEFSDCADVYTLYTTEMIKQLV